MLKSSCLDDSHCSDETFSLSLLCSGVHLFSLLFASLTLANWRDMLEVIKVTLLHSSQLIALSPVSGTYFYWLKCVAWLPLNINLLTNSTWLAHFIQATSQCVNVHCCTCFDCWVNNRSNCSLLSIRLKYQHWFIHHHLLRNSICYRNFWNRVETWAKRGV